MYSQSTSGSTQPGERPATARSGDVTSTRQHSITGARHWRGYYFLLFAVNLAVNTSEIDCPKRVVLGITYFVSSGILNLPCSLAHSLIATYTRGRKSMLYGTTYIHSSCRSDTHTHTHTHTQADAAIDA